MSIDEILINIRKTISSSKNVLMYFDTDTDGSCSYLQLRKAFSQIKSGFPISKDDESQKRAMDFFKDDFDLIIFFDTPYVNKDLIEKIGKTRIIWVDHHLDFGMKKYCEDHKNLFGFNPVWFNENDSRCSSYWAYKISGLRENLFYVCMASVADFYLLNVVKELYYEDKKLFNLLFDIDEVMREEIFDFLKKTRYDSVDDFDKKAYYIKYLSYNTDLIVFKNFFDLIYKLNRSEEVSMNTLNYIEKLSPLDFKAELFSGKIEHFEKFHVIFDEYKSIFNKINLDEVKENKLVIVEHRDASMSFNRQLSEELAFRLRNWEVICAVYSKSEKDLYSFSLRGHDRDVSELLKECLKDLRGRGGGHKFAAGGIVNKKDYEKFVSRLRRLV